MSKPIFYLHIPKTAGSSMNRFLINQFEEDETLLHIESRNIFKNQDTLDNADTYKLLSGHVSFPQMVKKMDVVNTRQTIATFRLPLAHVISHISWVRKLADPDERDRLQKHNKTIQKTAAKLAETDLSQPNEINGFIRWLVANKVFLFHNTQTKYLCGGGAAAFSPGLINQALQHLNQINYVGTVERLNEFISLLCYRLGFSQPNESSTIKENSNSRTYGLDIKDKSICRALQPLIGWDQVIYNQARHRFIDDLHQYLVELEKSKGPHYSSVKSKLV
jgi:hypothetical protein